MTGSLGIVGLFSSPSSSAIVTGASTDFTFTANVTAGRAYSFGLQTQFVGANYGYQLGVTDGTATWVWSDYLQSATTQWYGGWRAGGTLNRWGLTEQLYLPSTSGTKTFSIVRMNAAGSGAADSLFIASTDAPRQFWLRDLGQYPVSGTELGLVTYAESTTQVTINPGEYDPLSITATLSGVGRYRLVYRGQFDIFSATYVFINDGVNDYSVFQFPSGVAAGPLMSNALMLPTLNGSKTLRPRCNSGQFNAMGSAACPRQLWLERVA
jgi:hypothetical protein